MGRARLRSVGRYELLVELGRGGMAELYLARRRGVQGFEKLVAIKRILPHLAEDPIFVDMFVHEARVAARLSHVNICQVHELEQIEDELLLVMEYLEGATWADLCAATAVGESSLRLAAGVLGQACEGLHYAHALPLVHRDVSPQNLFVTVDGVCKVLDFGVAKMAKEGPRTRTGVLKGKLPYMAPEQIRGEELDARADVFSLGVVLWEALAKKSLFDRDTDFLIWKAITEDDVPKLAERGYPAAIDDVLGTALARNREERFGSVRALGEALRAVAATVGGPADAAAIAAALRSGCGDKLTARAQLIAASQSESSPAISVSVPSTPSAPSASTETAAAVPSEVRKTAAATSDMRAAAIAHASAPSSGLEVDELAMTFKRPSQPRVPRIRTTPVALPPIAPQKSRAPLFGGAAICIALGIGAAWMFAHSGEHAAAPVEPAPQAQPQAQPPQPQPQPPPQPVVVLPDAAVVTPVVDPAPPLPPPVGPERPKSPQQPPPPTPAHAKHPVHSAAHSDPLPVDLFEPPGSYSIDSTPYATIFIDGAKVGDTPLFHYNLTPGKHHVHAVRGDDAAKARDYDILIQSGTPMNAGQISWEPL